MAAARIYLVLVGLLYLGLGLYCAFAPTAAAKKVGFDLRGANGTSEFITVYGGLEVALAAVFLLSLVSVDATRFSLLACLVVHASLVLFRMASMLLLDGVGGSIYRLAIGEWVILLAGLAVYYFSPTARAFPS